MCAFTTTTFSLASKMILVAAVFSLACLANAGDLEPWNLTDIGGNFFTYTGMRGVVKGLKDDADADLKAFKVTRATAAEFPALNGEGISIAVLQFPPSSLNPPHVNTRSTGLLFVISGMLEVGLIDKKNKLFTQKLQTGNMFVFPKGLVHYQRNLDAKMNAVAVAAFGSTNAGTVSIPSSIFTAGIDVNVLAKAFNTDVLAVHKIEAGLTPNTYEEDYPN